MQNGRFYEENEGEAHTQVCVCTTSCAYTQVKNQQVCVYACVYAQVPTRDFVNEARGLRIWGPLGPIFGVAKANLKAISKENEHTLRWSSLLHTLHRLLGVGVV
ncbi:uncharacterized protein DS421_14g468620 [Arachis hypogaea]|nr:uncharacterized protein DS421_14g468620 [Arachis hypogaea]